MPSLSAPAQRTSEPQLHVSAFRARRAVARQQFAVHDYARAHARAESDGDAVARSSARAEQGFAQSGTVCVVADFHVVDAECLAKKFHNGRLAEVDVATVTYNARRVVDGAGRPEPHAVYVGNGKPAHRGDVFHECSDIRDDVLAGFGCAGDDGLFEQYVALLVRKTRLYGHSADVDADVSHNASAGTRGIPF